MILEKNVTTVCICLFVGLSAPLQCLADTTHFKYGPPFTHVRTFYDGLLTEPEPMNKQPEQSTMEQENELQAQYRKIRLDIVPGTKFDPRSNVLCLDKEVVALEDVSPSHWQFISHLPKLQGVGVSYTNSRDFKQGLFEALSTCPALASLSLNGDPSRVDLSCLRKPSVTDEHRILCARCAC